MPSNPSDRETMTRPSLRAGRLALATLTVMISLTTLVPGVASAGPSHADLVVGLVTDPTEVDPAGGTVRLDVSVRNAAAPRPPTPP